MRITRAIVLVSVVFVFACVTVNIYFPAAEAEKVAEDIVKEVRKGGAQTEEPSKSPAKPESHWWQLSSVAYAQEGALDVSNATIRALKDAMKSRYPELGSYLQKGILGENADGFLELKGMEGLSLPERAALNRLIDAENKDRKALYQEVALALRIEPGQIDKLQKIFAREWQKTAPPGTWIQDGDGQWVRKQ